MHYHSNATTNLKQRQAIRQSQESTRVIAAQYQGRSPLSANGATERFRRIGPAPRGQRSRR